MQHNGVFSEGHIATLKSCLKAFDPHTSNPLTNEIKRYLTFYQLPFDMIDYNYGFLDCNHEKIFIQSFSPQNRKGTIILLHGYLDHAGSLSKLISFLVSKQYAVICFDLPGHGLSTGVRADIHGFDAYTSILSSVVNTYKNDWSEPFYMIGHSTGGAISTDYLLSNPSHPFNKVILIAPLVRIRSWHLSTLTYHCLHPFTHQIKRRFSNNSSNHDYLTFVQADPLQSKTISLNWMHSLIKWNHHIRQRKISHTKVLIIQGEKDKTVDWKYNVNFLKQHFPNYIFHTLKEGKHQLLNESEELTNKIFEMIEAYLNK